RYVPTSPGDARGEAKSISLSAAPRLPNFEPFELRVSEIERLVVARLVMSGPERFRPGPGFKGGVVLPDRVRGIERVIVGFWSLEQVKLQKARHLVEIAVARRPDLLERGFGPLGYAKTIHGDEHRPISPDRRGQPNDRMRCRDCDPTNVRLTDTSA